MDRPTERQVIDEIDARTEFDKRWRRLSPWQAWVLLLYLNGHNLSRISEIYTNAGDPISKAGVASVYRTALRKIGIYDQLK